MSKSFDYKAVGSIQQKMEQKLIERFSPTKLQIINESDKHQGHSHHKGGVPVETGETHFHIIMSASVFVDMARPERHRLVYQALEAELKDSVHALALTLSAPH